ncbi:MAG: two pore domain potassium channel family protein [Armatimonadetes bacterium]|nr:two pore domain potassium channel family protein [Armatimonadota bacterium]
MDAVYAIAGAALVAASLWETFENVILTRCVSRRLRMSSVVFRWMWSVWRSAAARMRPGGKRENFLSFYGPLSILAMLFLFATALILGFALLHMAAHSRLAMDYGGFSFWVLLDMSGTEFFTLGLGDVAPVEGFGRALVAIESGVGFGFLAVVLSYLPVLYQAFSRREEQLSMLDEWAGSPPTA